MEKFDHNKIAGQNPNHIIKTLEKIFDEEGVGAALVMKNNLAISFFRMVINEEEISDKIKSIARSYLILYEFLSNFDEGLIDQQLP